MSNGGATSIMHAMPDMVFTLGRDGVVSEYLGGGGRNPLFDPKQIVSAQPESAWPEAEIGAEVRRAAQRVLTTRESYSCRFSIDAARYEFRFNVQGRDRVLLIVRDITTQADSSGSFIFDPLTSLPSLASFRERIDEAIAKARLREQGLAVLHIDLDGFSQINETFGQAVGDSVLKETAERLRTCVRGADTLLKAIDENNPGEVARAEGDDFVLLLDNVTTRESVTAVIDRIRLALSLPFCCGKGELKLTQSLGIVFYPRDGADTPSLLGNARAALREAKLSGRNGQEFYSDTMRMRRIDREIELREALEQQQFELHYLPKVELCTGRVAGMEALLRWQHPLRGCVPLGEVLSIAEPTGLIVELGEWIMRRACQQAREWSTAGVNALPVGVNLSRREFARDDLLEWVSSVLDECQVAGAQIELEITEDVLLRTRNAPDLLGRLKRRGVGIVLDDFGTGVFSILQLKRLPLDALKIDYSIISRLNDDDEARVVCAAILAMTRELDLRVIAEGVEDEQQLAFLRERGCDLAQGFYFSRPLPTGAVAEYLAGSSQSPRSEPAG